MQRAGFGLSLPSAVGAGVALAGAPDRGGRGQAGLGFAASRRGAGPLRSGAAGRPRAGRARTRALLAAPPSPFRSAGSRPGEEPRPIFSPLQQKGPSSRSQLRERSRWRGCRACPWFVPGHSSLPSPSGPHGRRSPPPGGQVLPPLGRGPRRSQTVQTAAPPHSGPRRRPSRLGMRRRPRREPFR